MRRAISVFSAAALFLFGVSACTRASAPIVGMTHVASEPAAPLPSWILSTAPHDAASSNAQIRVLFSDDLIPLESLEAPNHQDVLSHFHMEPALPGRFALLTPRMVAFVADEPLPAATRVRVTLTPGLADLQGHALNRPYAWTFQTEDLKLASDLPDERHDQDATPSTLAPTILVSSNAEADEGSLLEHARLFDAADPGTAIPLVRKAQASPSPEPVDAAPGENQTPRFTYALTPAHDLDRERRYRLEIEAGVLPVHGNMPSKDRLVGLLDTFGPLRLRGSTPYGKPDKDGAPGLFANGAVQLLFSNGLLAQSAEKAISTQPPPPAGVPLVRIDDGDTAVTLNPHAFAPNRQYLVTIAADLKDVFGQTLGAPATQTISTGNLAGDLWAPSGFRIFPSTENLALNVVSVNLLEGEYHAAYHTVTPEELIFADPAEDAGLEKLLPPQNAWSTVGAALGNNKIETQRIPLRERLGGRTGILAYGIAGKTNEIVDAAGGADIARASFMGAAEITDIGVFAQWFPDTGLVRAHRLSDGAPIAGAQITVYPSHADDTSTEKHGSVEPCASGVTGADGSLELRGAAFVRCAVVSKRAENAPSLLVIARKNGDWAFVRTDDWSGAYGYGVPMGWSAGAPEAHGVVMSDRDLYQPGETAYVAGIAYFDVNGVLGKSRASSYRLTLEGPDGSKRDLGAVALDAFGGFSRAISLGKRQELGYYTVHAHADGGEDLNGTFRVAAFKPPNFKVALNLDRAYATSGQRVAASWQSAYLFGAPVQGGVSHTYVTRSRAWFSPEGWDTFAFGRAWTSPEEEPAVSGDVLQRDARVPADGKNEQEIAVADDLPYPMTYQVDVQTVDVANMSVDDTKTFTALPSDRLIGVQSDYVATAGRPHEIAVIVTDPEGKPVIGRRVRAVLQERSYGSATQETEGSQTPVDSVHYVDVASAEVTSGERAARVSLTPLKAGSYRIRANFSDAKNDTTATDAQLWVSGSDADWGRDDGGALAVKLDKTSYRPGETAHVLVQSPYPQAELLLAVVRHGVILKETSIVRGAAPQAAFTVTPNMLPNAAVEAVLVRRGAALERGIPQGLIDLARVGFAPFDVALDAKYLKTTITPEHDRLGPQETQSVRVHVTDAAGRGVRAEIVAAVVNDQVLQLSGYRFPDVAKIVYAQEPISSRLADNREAVTLASPMQATEKGFGYGGGFAAGAAGTRVRTQFKPLAFYDATIKTDASGNATLRFKTPDDLTTWRVMTTAFTQDARFGSADATFMVTKTLATNAVLPQFARPGDVFFGGVSVTDTERTSGEVGISGVLGGDLAFVDKDGNASSTTTFSAPVDQITKAFRFPMRSTGNRAGNVQFATLLGNDRDAFTASLEMRSNDATESTVETGVTAQSAAIPFTVDARAPNDLGGLDVALASTLLPDVQEVVRASSADETPLATAVASRASVAADALVLDRRYKQSADVSALQATLSADLDALRSLQREDGGYALWPGAATSDIAPSAFSARSLARARAAGAHVDADIARVRGFLLSRLNDPSREPGGDREPKRGEMRLQALTALSALGETRNDHLSDIYAQRKHFSFYEQLELARYLLSTPGRRAQGTELRDALFEQTHLTGRGAAATTSSSSWETATASQAQLLALLIDSHTRAEDVDRAFRTLLDLRVNGIWPCSSDNAQGMDAVVAYAAFAPPSSDFKATVRLAPGNALDAQFSGSGNATFTRHVPFDKLPRGNAVITVTKTGKGAVHYLIAYRYGVSGEREGAYGGIRLERILRSVVDEKEQARFGLAAPNVPITAEAGRVFEAEDRITTDHAINHVFLTDPLPAGFEAVDASFQTSTRRFEPGLDNWEIDYRQIYPDRIIAFARHLEPGVYAVHYLVRSVTPGTFAWPGAQVHQEYAPEDFGRTAAGSLVIR